MEAQLVRLCILHPDERGYVQNMTFPKLSCLTYCGAIPGVRRDRHMGSWLDRGSFCSRILKFCWESRNLFFFFFQLSAKRKAVYSFYFTSNSFKENYFFSIKLPISHLKKTGWKESFWPVPATKHQFLHFAILLYESFVHHWAQLFQAT